MASSGVSPFAPLDTSLFNDEQVDRVLKANIIPAYTGDSYKDFIPTVKERMVDILECWRFIVISKMQKGKLIAKISNIEPIFPAKLIHRVIESRKPEDQKDILANAMHDTKIPRGSLNADALAILTSCFQERFGFTNVTFESTPNWDNVKLKNLLQTQVLKNVEKTFEVSVYWTPAHPIFVAVNNEEPDPQPQALPATLPCEQCDETSSDDDYASASSSSSFATDSSESFETDHFA